jgi:hypothetical protein
MHMTAGFGAGGRRGGSLGQKREELVLEAEEGDLGRSKKEEAMSGKGGMFEVRCGPAMNCRASQSRWVWLAQSASS